MISQFVLSDTKILFYNREGAWGWSGKEDYRKFLTKFVHGEINRVDKVTNDGENDNKSQWNRTFSTQNENHSELKSGKNSVADCRSIVSQQELRSTVVSSRKMSGLCQCLKLRKNDDFIERASKTRRVKSSKNK